MSTMALSLLLLILLLTPERLAVGILSLVRVLVLIRVGLVSVLARTISVLISSSVV